MISKAKSKFIKSLQIKKYRKQEQCFVVEGRKSVEELLQSDFKVITLAGTPDFLKHIHLRKEQHSIEVLETSTEELQRFGQFKSNDAALAVACMKPNQLPEVGYHEFVLVLNDIRDPGNLGTIIRAADWYGVRTIIASEETADFYNSKVITSTMGSFTRVQVYYTNLASYLVHHDKPVWGAFLEGENIHETAFDSGGFIVIGNESSGISPDIEKLITQKITIPRFGRAESLNAAMATVVILDNLRRGRGKAHE